MKDKYWSIKEIERYCKMILGTTPKIKFKSRKKLKGFGAISYFYPPQKIRFSDRKFNRTLLWHECGHLMGLQQGSKHWHWTSERDAQLNAIRRALDMGFINVARELIEHSAAWSKVKDTIDYPRAHRELIKELNP